MDDLLKYAAAVDAKEDSLKLLQFQQAELAERLHLAKSKQRLVMCAFEAASEEFHNLGGRITTSQETEAWDATEACASRIVLESMRKSIDVVARATALSPKLMAAIANDVARYNKQALNLSHSIVNYVNRAAHLEALRTDFRAELSTAEGQRCDVVALDSVSRHTLEETREKHRRSSQHSQALHTRLATFSSQLATGNEALSKAQERVSVLRQQLEGTLSKIEAVEKLVAATQLSTHELSVLSADALSRAQGPHASAIAPPRSTPAGYYSSTLPTTGSGSNGRAVPVSSHHDSGWTGPTLGTSTRVGYASTGASALPTSFGDDYGASGGFASTPQAGGGYAGVGGSAPQAAAPPLAITGSTSGHLHPRAYPSTATNMTSGVPLASAKPKPGLRPIVLPPRR